MKDSTNSSKNNITNNQEKNDYIHVICRIQPSTDDSDDGRNQDLSAFLTSNSTIATQHNQRAIIPVTIDDKFLNDSTRSNTPSNNEKKQSSIITSYSSSQEEFYKQHISKLIQSINQGYNGTIIAYGPSGSGKTFTTREREEEDDTNNNSSFQSSLFTVKMHHGIIPRALQDIFDYYNLRNRTEGKYTISKEEEEVTFSLSYLQMYCELLQDLLSMDDDDDDDDNIFDNKESTTTKIKNKNKHQRSGLHLREVKTSTNKIGSNNDQKLVTIENLRKVPVSNLDECIKLLRMGDQKRATCRSNEYNSYYNSSRSHAIVILNITRRHQQRIVSQQEQHQQMAVTTNTLTVVDLAGSERIDLSNTITNNYQRMEELKANNLSLTALRNCISSLSKVSSGNAASTATAFIPYRDSKLTRLLQPSLSYNGNNKTLFIVCLPNNNISSSTEHQAYYDNENKEIMIRHSMEFAQLLSNIRKNKANKVEANIDYESLYHELQKNVDYSNDTIQLLELEKDKLQTQVYTIQEKMEDVQAQNDSLAEAMRLINSNPISSSSASKIESPSYHQKSNNTTPSKKEEDAAVVAQLVWKEEINRLLQIHQQEVQQLKLKYNQQISAYKESASKSILKYNTLHQETIQQQREHLTALQTVRNLTQQFNDVESEKTKRISELLNELQDVQFTLSNLKLTVSKKEGEHDEMIQNHKIQSEEKTMELRKQMLQHEKENTNNQNSGSTTTATTTKEQKNETKVLKEMETLFTDTLSTLSQRVQILEVEDNNKYSKTTTTRGSRKNMDPKSRKILENLESQYSSSIPSSSSNYILKKKQHATRWMGKSYK